MTPLYTQQQIVFSLNSIANSPSGRHGTAAELQAYAKSIITKVFSDTAAIALIGEWALVWGPMVFQNQGSTVADNAMYVAQSKSDPSQYVVAISGTNPISAYGWVVEDFMINPTVPWPYGSASPAIKGAITHGTNVGLGVLLNTLKDNGLTLSAYLASQVSASAAPLTITVTGHSLGGALSPATALALLDTQGIALGQANGWDPTSKSTIAVLPTAGPTPGDVVWRDYYDDRIGANTDRLWNAIDIVPHAWQLDMLAEIPDIYAPTIAENALIKGVVGLAELNSTLAGDLQQISPSVVGLPGKVNASITLTIDDIIAILETMLANDLLGRLAKALGLSADVLALLEALVDDYIKYLNGQKAQQTNLPLSSLTSLSSDNRSKLQAQADSVLGFFDSFMDFLIQAGYQHTTAYSELLGTEAFADIVSAIRVLD